MRRLTSVGGDVPLAELANVIAPGCRGIDIHLEVGEGGQLHAEVCIDGSKYRGTAEIAPLLEAVARAPENAGNPDQGAAAMAEAVDVAGTILAGALVEQHERVISGGWWGAIKGAVNAVVVNPTKKSYKYTGKVMRSSRARSPSRPPPSRRCTAARPPAPPRRS